MCYITPNYENTKPSVQEALSKLSPGRVVTLEAFCACLLDDNPKPFPHEYSRTSVYGGRGPIPRKLVLEILKEQSELKQIILVLLGFQKHLIQKHFLTM